MKKIKKNHNAESNGIRADGVEARTRLLETALNLFAEQGFAKTSIREIARQAQVNISAISYYFGDKAGLYRAVFYDPRTNPCIQAGDFSDPNLSLKTGLEILVRAYTESMKQGDVVQHYVKIHIREMLEPTGLWHEEIENMIKPTHHAFVKFLCKELNIKRVDDDIHRLVFSIIGMAMSMMVNADVMMAVRPQLLKNAKAIDAFTDYIISMSEQLVEAERARRLK
jgi:AcrR family transcriptional regulator